jgi:hypothetical protein
MYKIKDKSYFKIFIKTNVSLLPFFVAKQKVIIYKRYRKQQISQSYFNVKNTVDDVNLHY